MDFVYIICVFLSALLLHDCFGQEPDNVDSQSTSFQIKISPESPDQLVQLGSNRVLTCSSATTDNSQKPVLHWEVGDKKIEATAKSERIRIEYTGDGNLRLRIEGVRNEDAATYRCVGTLDTQTNSQIVKLEVYEAIAVDFPKEQFGIFEQNGVVFCNATGKPVPTIGWKFENGSNIVNSDKYDVQGNQLIIKNLTFDDGREYVCDVTVISTGENDLVSINFAVVKNPVIEEAPTITPSSPKVGEDVTLTCQAVGVPAPTYQFKKGESFLPEDQVDEKNGILTISNLKQEDEGEYICVASNRGGSDEKGSFLDVKIPPTIRDMPPITEAVEGEQKQIMCQAEGDPVPTVTWKKDGLEISSDDDTDNDGLKLTDETGSDQGSASNKTSVKTLNFDSIRPHHAGTYTCTADSSVGSDSKTVKLEVKYKPHFNTDFKETIFYGWADHTANLTCLASANEVATIQWYKTSETETPDVPLETGGPYTVRPTVQWPEHHLSSSSLLVSIGANDSGVYGDYQCKADNSLSSTIHTVRLTKAEPPAEPTVSVSNIWSTMIELEVEAPEEDGGQPVLGYQYSYFPSNDSSNVVEQEIDIAGDKTPVKLRNLIAKTSYVFKVKAKNAVGYGKEISQPLDTMEVSKPLQLNMTSPRQGSEPTSYKIVWAKPEDSGAAITQFIIRYKKVTIIDEEASQWQAESDVDKKFEEKILYDPYALSYNIENLERDSYYDVRIIAVNKEGESTEEAKIIKTSEGADEDEESEVEEDADDNDENSINVGDVDNEKDEEEDGKAGDALRGKSGSESTGSAGLGSGAVVGIPIAIVILIVIIAVFIFLVVKKKPELVGRLRGLGGKGGEEERGKSDDGKDPAEEEKLIKKDDTIKVENETEEGKPEHVIEEQQEEFEPDSKPEAQPTPDSGAKTGTGEKSPELSTPAPTTEIKITPETPEKPENPTA